MSGLGGRTKTIDTSPPEIQELRNQFLNYIGGRPAVPGISSAEFDDWLRRTYPRGTKQGTRNTPGRRGELYEEYRRQYQPTTGGGAGGTGGFFDRIFRPASVDRPGEVGLDARAWIDRNAIPRATTSFAAPEIDPINRGMVRDISGVPDIYAPSTQSVDQLGGVKSDFFRNVMSQLAPAFAQRRAEGLAAAREAAGNLTGTGRSNFLGGAINRSLGEEQATLANYATQGLQTEVGRQQGDAARALEAARANQGVAFQTGAANQAADISFLGSLLERGRLNQGAALQAAELGQRGEFANINSVLQALTGNQDVARLLAQLQQQRELGIYGVESEARQRESQNFLSALLALFGIQNTPYQTGGPGAVIGPLIGAGATYAGSRGR